MFNVPFKSKCWDGLGGDLTFLLAESDKQIKNLVTEISIVSIILLYITISLIFYIVRKATSPLKKKKKMDLKIYYILMMQILLKYRIKDEIGEVAVNLFNAYMEKVRDGLKTRWNGYRRSKWYFRKKNSKWFFVYKVNSTSIKSSCWRFKNRLNSMIVTTKETLDKINETLRYYSESKFDFKINDDGIYGN